MTNMKNTKKQLLSRIGVGFAGLILLPTLSILSIFFIFLGFALPAISFTNLFGFTNIPFNVAFYQVTGILQVMIAIIVGIVFLAAGYGCFMGLKRFLRWGGNVFKS